MQVEHCAWTLLHMPPVSHGAPKGHLTPPAQASAAQVVSQAHELWQLICLEQAPWLLQVTEHWPAPHWIAPWHDVLPPHLMTTLVEPEASMSPAHVPWLEHVTSQRPVPQVILPSQASFPPQAIRTSVALLPSIVEPQVPWLEQDTTQGTPAGHTIGPGQPSSEPHAKVHWVTDQVPPASVQGGHVASPTLQPVGGSVVVVVAVVPVPVVPVSVVPAAPPPAPPGALSVAVAVVVVGAPPAPPVVTVEPAPAPDEADA